MKLKVYLWNATTPFRSLEEYGPLDTVTDIADNHVVPRKGSIVIGLRSGDDGLVAIALGIVRAKTFVATGRSRFRVKQLLMIRPQPWRSVAAGLDRHARTKATKDWLPATAEPVLLPAGAAAVILGSLSTDPQIADWLGSIESRGAEPVDMGRDRLVHEARDAVSLAMTIADPQMKLDYEPFNGPQHPSAGDDLLAAVVNNQYLRDWEEDLIPEELGRFLKDTEVHPTGKAHAAIFKGRDYRLMVLNVNKKPLEEALGVDLIYWDVDRNSFTMVQYKRFDREPDDDGKQEWGYKRKGELDKQLSVMQEYALTEAEAADPRNWRMASPYWFKFVKRDAAKKDDGELLDGIYVPAGYLRTALDNDSLKVGPRKGFRITYDNTLRVTKATFADLIRRGAIGTAGGQSDDILEIIKGPKYEDRAAIIAVRQEWTRGRLQAAHPVSTNEADGAGRLDAFRG